VSAEEVTTQQLGQNSVDSEFQNTVKKQNDRHKEQQKQEAER
jgi:hypothetical protein